MKAQGPAPADESLVTAVGVILAPTATELEATFADGQTQTIQLHRLSARAARRIGSIRFRTAAFAVRGEWCPTQLTSRSPSGNVLWTSQVFDCADALGAGEVVEGVS